VSKLAQEGKFETLNVSVSPSGSLAVGWNRYAVPCTTAVDGWPEIVGARFVLGADVTVIENAGSDAVAVPSLTLICTLPYTPTSADVGVPLSAPVEALKAAQAGLLAIVNTSASLSASLATGVKP
jgi:hypothetical protein